MTRGERILRWTGGCLGLLVLAILCLVVWVKWLFLPTVTLSVRSPDRWQIARLQRPTGSMEPKYYSVTLGSDWPFGARCGAAQFSGWEAERYVRLSWATPQTLVIRYGLSRYDRKREGRMYVAQGDNRCRALRVVVRHDPTLDAEATSANLLNHDYDNPPRPEDADGFLLPDNAS